MNIYIETYGCSANQNNSEIITGLLERAGFIVTTNKEIAKIALINTCIVKGPTEQKMCSRIKELSKSFDKLIVVGCMVDTEEGKIKNIIRENNERCNFALVGVHNITKILDAVRAIMKGKNAEFKEKTKEVKLCLPKKRRNKVIGITQIASGCLGECSYCYVKFAKGNLFSFPEEKILKNIELDLKAGCKEIWITSQDNACYGLDRGKQELPELLRKILSLKHEFFLRLGMMNPNYVLPILEQLIECYKDEKMFKFLHLPLQSGSDIILEKMNRNYKTEDFMKIIKKFRKEIPEISISTDIIVGFPTEEEKDFEKTLEIIKKTEPDVVNISKFWAMPRTRAKKMKQISSEIIKKRTAELVKVCKEISFEKNKRFIGKIVRAITDEKGSFDTWIARTTNYKPVVFFSKENMLGKIINLEIVDSRQTYLVGKLF
ncbi:MAG: tRNA (N(6)-L-threonylcarbamoyladenosine(37)-C(2))-methylthiotransferase [Candidatus Pacearchaeota archaeon]|nr:tRNA (N(6)-L-threonylcarbamoyladenosine(37)-C(2))-methylthiotransferase [Candidatus Pacearchaeota archaeon]